MINNPANKSQMQSRSWCLNLQTQVIFDLMQQD